LAVLLFSLPSRSLYGTPKLYETQKVHPLPDALRYRTVPAPLF